MTDSDLRPIIRPCHGPQEYAALVDIWRSAVRATHDFLDEADFARIESHLASDYFPAVTLTVAEAEGAPMGFSGVVDGSLEMLFVSAAARGRGIGSALLAKAVQNQSVTRVDVNEQNPEALCEQGVRPGRTQRARRRRPALPAPPPGVAGRPLTRHHWMSSISALRCQCSRTMSGSWA
jgi:putative acetyltransferase